MPRRIDLPRQARLVFGVPCTGGTAAVNGGPLGSHAGAALQGGGSQLRGRTARVACALGALLALALWTTAYGQTTDQPPDMKARQIAEELRCPICEGLSVADSPSQLAVQMRGVILQKVEAGESREQILTYFVDRYGETILMEPPRSGFTTIAWVAPYVALLATLAFLGWKLRERRGQRATEPETDPSLEPFLDEVDRTYDIVHDEAIR